MTPFVQMLSCSFELTTKIIALITAVLVLEHELRK